MLSRLRTMAFSRGVVGDSRAFLGIWIVLAGLRLLKKIAGNEPEVVYRETLEPGQQIVITHETRTHG